MQSLKLLSEFFPFRPGDEAVCKENEILKHSGYRRLKNDAMMK